ncbi:hypothetical protein Ac2012v2_001194 [Leucoagaricus gongylophorus]
MVSTEVKVAAVIGEQTLKLLKEASKYVPFPAVGLAATFALEILQAAVAADGNQEAFKDIGKDACDVVTVIIHRVNRCATGDPTSMKTTDLEEDATALVHEMRKIKHTVTKHTKRKLLRRLVLNADDADAVQQCRHRLAYVLKLFGLQSDIELRQQIAILNRKIDQVLESVQPNLSSQSLQPTLSEQTTIFNTGPSSSPQLSSSLQPQSSSSLQPQPSREERRAARYARKGARQHVTSFPDVPPLSHMPLSHMPPSDHIYINGDATTISRDDSFNVSGTGNNINISYTR